MAPWGDAKLLFCAIIITCCCTVTLAQLPMDCCLTVTNKTIPKHCLAGYRQQFSGQGCTLDAMILVTRQNVNLCVPPDEQWVQQVVDHVKQLKKHCKKTKYKGRRCTGVTHESTENTQ